MRDIKEPEVRRAEILMTAMNLFYSKGYLKTTTQDIIEELKISRGLLYYYFKNKEDILFHIVEKYSEPILKQIEQLTYSNQYDAIEKVRKFIEISLVLPDSATVTEATNETLSLQEAVNLEENRYMMDRFYHKATKTITIYFTHIIEQGNKEGSFLVDYPRETAAFLMTGFTFVSNDAKLECENLEQLWNYISSFKIMLERVLGVSNPIFSD